MANKIRGEQVKDNTITGADVDESTLILDTLRDADGDTKIQIEESADEDKIRFDTAGTERMIIDEAGAVGIGVTSPEDILHIRGTAVTTRLQIENTATDGDPILMLQTGGATNWYMGIDDSDSDKLMFMSDGGAWDPTSAEVTFATDGKVGIGITDPTAQLHAYGDVSNQYVAIIDNNESGSAHGLKVTSDGTDSGTNILDVESESTTVFRIRGDGSIGFGPSSVPGAANSYNFFNFKGGGVRVQGNNFYCDNDKGLYWGDSSVMIKANASNAAESLTVKANYNAYIHVDGVNDNVGIGTITPSASLHVNGRTYTEGGVKVLIRDVNATSTLTIDDYCIRCVQSSLITLTLPSKTNNSGQVLIFKDALGNAAASNIVLDGNGGDTIDGVATYTINSNKEGVTLLCDGINGWMIVSRVKP